MNFARPVSNQNVLQVFILIIYFEIYDHKVDNFSIYKVLFFTFPSGLKTRLVSWQLMLTFATGSCFFLAKSQTDRKVPLAQAKIVECEGDHSAPMTAL
jgi:hypothetical protein